jgi:hypothetical protein
MCGVEGHAPFRLSYVNRGNRATATASLPGRDQRPAIDVLQGGKSSKPVSSPVTYQDFQISIGRLS